MCLDKKLKNSSVAPLSPVPHPATNSTHFLGALGNPAHLNMDTDQAKLTLYWSRARENAVGSKRKVMGSSSSTHTAVQGAMEMAAMEKQSKMGLVTAK